MKQPLRSLIIPGLVAPGHSNRDTCSRGELVVANRRYALAWVTWRITVVLAMRRNLEDGWVDAGELVISPMYAPQYIEQVRSRVGLAVRLESNGRRRWRICWDPADIWIGSEVARLGDQQLTQEYEDWKNRRWN